MTEAWGLYLMGVLTGVLLVYAIGQYLWWKQGWAESRADLEEYQRRQDRG